MATMAMSDSTRKWLLKEEDMTKVEFETSEEVDVTPTFDTMGLREDLLRSIYAYGFEKPSAIQQRAIKLIFKGRDVIARLSLAPARRPPSASQSFSAWISRFEKPRL